MRIVAFLVLLGLGGALAFSLAKHQREDAALVALRDTVRITDSVIVVRTETVVKYQRRVDTVRAVSDSLDARVTIVDDSTLHVTGSLSDTAIVVPRVVVADIQALRLTVTTQDTLIRSLYAKDSTQEWRIATRDKRHAAEMRQARAPRWGYGATVGYGCNPNGCGPTLSVGLSYQAPLPNWRALIAKVVK